MSKKLPNLSKKTINSSTTSNKSTPTKPNKPRISNKRTKLSPDIANSRSATLKTTSPRNKKDEVEKKKKIKAVKSKRHKRSAENVRQYRRVMAFIRRAEKRGYRFDKEFKETIPILTTAQLKGLGPNALYEEAYYYYEGEIISGTVARAMERSIAAQKGAETKRIKREQREQEYIPSYSSIVLEEIRSLIKQYSSQKSEVRGGIADYLLELLEAEISKYGEEVVAKSCEQAPDEIKALVVSIIHDSNDERRTRKVTEFIQLITGEIPSVDDSKEFTELAEELNAFSTY